MPVGEPALPPKLPARHLAMPAPPMGHGGDPSRTPIAPKDGGHHLGKWRWPKWLPPPKVLLVVLIVVAFGLLLYRIRGDLDTAFHRVRLSGLVWLPVAFVAEGISFFAYALVQRRLLVAGGAHMSRRTVAGLTVAATGISNLVPGGTAPSSGWLVSQYRRHGIPMPLALWTVLAGGFTAAMSELLLCLVGAGVAGLLGPGPLVGVVVLLVGVAVAGVVVSHRLAAVRGWLERDRKLPGLRLARRAIRHAGDVAHFRATISGGAEVYLLSMVNWVLDAVVLAIGFAVLALPVPWHALLFAYTAAQIAGSLAPVPGGIGFVEGGMIGALTLAGTPAGDAVVATVIYRLVTTLGMAGIGGLALVAVHRGTPKQARLTGIAATLANRGKSGDRVAGAPDAGAPDAGAPSLDGDAKEPGGTAAGGTAGGGTAGGGTAGGGTVGGGTAAREGTDAG